MKIRIWFLVLATALAAAPATAQDRAFENVFQAFRLPKATQEARVLGVPESDIQSIFDTARGKQLPAGALVELFDGGNEAIRQHGPIDNFGAFVQARLDDGLRGRDLAAAIRAEHGARGKGKGYVNSPGGPETTHGRKPEVTGKPGGAGGKPGVTGKSGQRGGKPDTVKTKKGGPR